VSVALADPFKVAVITGLATVLTTLEVTVNVAVVAPAATITLAGTVAAAGVSLDSGTVLCAFVPAAGAFNVNVAVEFADPPTRLVGLSTSDTTAGGGVTVRAALCCAPFRVAEIFAVLVAATTTLVTVKFADVAPAATVTVAGAVAAAGLSLDSVTVLCAVVPTAGAFNVTVPVELINPPGTLAGLTASDTSAGRGVTVRGATWLTPFKVAEIFAVVVAGTTRLVTVKFADVAPAATVTVAGAVADAVLSLNSVNVR
jgi:hypothetical protein